MMYAFIIALTFLVISFLALSRFRWADRRRGVLKRYAEQYGYEVLGKDVTTATSYFTETTSFSGMDIPCILLKDHDILFDCSSRLLGGKVVVESRQSVFCQRMPDLSDCEMLFVHRRTPDRFITSERFELINSTPETGKSIVIYSTAGYSCTSNLLEHVIDFCDSENMNVHVSRGWVFVYRPSKVFDEQSLTHGFSLLHQAVSFLRRDLLQTPL